jgi:hypothetical protein
MNLDVGEEQKKNIYPVDRLRLKSHGGQFASGPRRLMCGWPPEARVIHEKYGAAAS